MIRLTKFVGQRIGIVVYIVAGDEMQKLMNSNFPERKTIPFREDFSQGEYIGFSVDSEFIGKRASLLNVCEDEYVEIFSPIINLDMSQRCVLCFGVDECCKANLEFMIGYLKYKGYSQPLKVQILDEYTLDVQAEYFADLI